MVRKRQLPAKSKKLTKEDIAWSMEAKAAGVLQKVRAAELGIHPTTLWQWERLAERMGFCAWPGYR